MIDELRQHIADAQRLITDALSLPTGPTQQAEIVQLIRRRVEGGDQHLWLLASLVLANCAIGVVEAWLDSPDTDEQVADILRDNLAVLLTEDIGPRLTEETGLGIVVDVARRHVSWHEVVTPLTFVMETLTMNTDPDIEALLLLS